MKNTNSHEIKTMIKCFKENLSDDWWTYIVNVWIDGKCYIKRALEIPDIQNLKYVENNMQLYDPPKGIYDAYGWILDLRKDGFGEYSYYDPFKIQRRRKKKRLTKDEKAKLKMKNFKKTLIKRKPKDETLANV